MKVDWLDRQMVRIIGVIVGERELWTPFDALLLWAWFVRFCLSPSRQYYFRIKVQEETSDYLAN